MDKPVDLNMSLIETMGQSILDPMFWLKNGNEKTLSKIIVKTNGSDYTLK